MKFNPDRIWRAGFVGLFAVLIVSVFWGTWSLDFAPVMPDDPYNWATPYSGTLTAYWNAFLATGKMHPADVLWSGLLFSPHFCQELKYAVGVFCAAVGLAWLLRGRGLSTLASCGAGLLLAFSGYWLTLFSAGHGGWFIWMTYGVFAFGLVDRAVRTGRLRYWLLLGLDVSWAGFQQQDLWLLFTAFTSIYFVWCCVRERTFPWKGALVSLVAFALVGLPNFKDTIQHTLKGRIDQMARDENVTQKNASEADKRWEFVTNWSMPTEDTLEFVNARVHGDTSCPFVLSINGPKGVRPYTGALGRPLHASQGNYRQHSLYVGWITCLLAVFGATAGLAVLGRRRNSDLVFFALAALVFYAFSLGRHCEPAYRLIFALPFGDLIRCPVKWHHLTELCLCVLAGYGIEALRESRPLKSLRAAKGWMADVLLALVVVAGAVDLAGEAHRFCAPVNVGPARRTDSTMQMTVLTRQQFQNPQVAEMARRGRLVSLANYLGNPDYFLVGVLEPSRPGKPQPDGLALGLGAVSLTTVAGILFLVLRRKDAVV